MQQPKLRFKTDDGDDFPNLEVKRLGDITIPYNVRNKNTLPLEIYSVNNIVGFVPQSEQFDDAGYLRNTDTSIYMIVPPKHFAYNPARIDIGSIGYQYLDHDVQVSSLYEVFKTSDSVDDDFLWMWFHTSYFNHTVKRLQEGGVRLYFYYDKMQETKIGLPSLAEQQKIALLFSELDTLIQSTEKELEGYRELKQCMLQKMFPKKGETVPEIRFSEFTNDWELCMLGEITKTNPFKPFIAEGASDGSYEVIQQGDTPISGYADGQPFQNYENITIFGDHTLSLYKPKSPFFVASDGVKILSPSIDMDGLFYYYLLTKHKPNSEGYKRHYTIMKGCEASYPTNRDEQMRIAEYFKNLDNLIISQQKELDGYKELKKGLLQQMFC